MKRTLSVIIALIIAILLTSCREKIIENHPDAIAAAEELQNQLKIFEDYSDGMIMTYAAARETDVVVTLLVNDEGYEDYKNDEKTKDGVSPTRYGVDVNEFIHSLENLDDNATVFSNPFELPDMTAKYPSIDSFEFVVKNYDGKIYYEQKFKK